MKGQKAEGRKQKAGVALACFLLAAFCLLGFYACFRRNHNRGIGVGDVLGAQGF